MFISLIVTTPKMTETIKFPKDFSFLPFPKGKIIAMKQNVTKYSITQLIIQNQADRKKQKPPAI